MKIRIHLSSILLFVAILFVASTSFSYEYFNYNKWPITRRNKTNLKKEITIYYDKDNNLIEKFESNFNSKGYLIERVYICIYLKKQSKKIKYYYKNDILSQQEEYDYNDKLASTRKYEFAGNSKIIITTHSDSNSKYNEIYEYDNRGLLKSQRTPIDEEELVYEYDKHQNIVKVTFHGPDGVSENNIDIAYDDKGNKIKEGKVRYTYYEDGRIKEIIPYGETSKYRLIKYEFIYYDDKK